MASLCCTPCAPSLGGCSSLRLAVNQADRRSVGCQRGVVFVRCESTSDDKGTKDKDDDKVHQFLYI
jgi:hypothetical protein